MSKDFPTFKVAPTRMRIERYLDTVDPHGREGQTASIMIGVCRDIEKEGQAKNDLNAAHLIGWAEARGLLAHHDW